MRTKRRTKTKKRITIRPLVDMPARKATEKFLVATFDVTGLSLGQLDTLILELAAQSEASDHGHPSIPSPTFVLRTMRYERATDGTTMCVAAHDKDL